LFVESDGAPPPSKRRRAIQAVAPDGGGEDDKKKKLAMDISYEGFSIYGRVLCLVVKRRESSSGATLGVGVTSAAGGGAGRSGSTKAGGASGQAMMENFIISTQIPVGSDTT
jgi:hypothetical protein